MSRTATFSFRKSICSNSKGSASIYLPSALQGRQEIRRNGFNNPLFSKLFIQTNFFVRHLIGYCLKEPEKWNEAISTFINDPENENANGPPPEDRDAAPEPETGRMYLAIYNSNCKIIASALYWISIGDLTQTYKPVKQTTPNDKIDEALQPGTIGDLVFDTSGEGAGADPGREDNPEDPSAPKTKKKKPKENSSPMIKGLYSEAEMEPLLGNKLFVEDALSKVKAIASRFNKELAQVDLCLRMREMRGMLGLKTKIIKATEKRFPAYPDILEDYFYAIQKKFRIKTKELEEEYRGNKYDEKAEEAGDEGDGQGMPGEGGPEGGDPPPGDDGDEGDS